MYRVKVLRTRGARKHDREIQSDAGTTGRLMPALVGTEYELKLYAADDGSPREPILPLLHNAQLVSMHSNKMLFRGIERAGGAGYEQEWSVMILP